MDEEKLYVAECFSGNATNFKRMHPRAQGRAYSILKRNSHITVILDERKEQEKKAVSSKKVEEVKASEGGNNGSES